MPQLVIRFRRPDTMSDEEMHGWLAQRAHWRQPAVAVTRVGEPGDEALVVHAADPVEDQLLDLLMDMRLLGMRPSPELRDAPEG
ncbi:MAG TPA: hypothetical protein VE992_03800 [Solirubrobacteraceae bacterium]|nr:hypothetical protein [Solirubrobacteraceae bacterium]